MSNKYEHIISLGKLCLPRMIIDHFKMREKFPIRMPFDGSYHEYNFMCDMLSSNFENYLDNSQLVKISENKNMWSKKKAYWNHEKTEDFLELQKNCKARIAQFNYVMTEAKSVMFLFWDEDKQHTTKIEKLVKILKHTWPDLKFHVTHYNTYLHDDFKIDGMNHTYINKPFPKERGCANTNILKKENADYLNNFMTVFCGLLEEDPLKYIK